MKRFKWIFLLGLGLFFLAYSSEAQDINATLKKNFELVIPQGQELAYTLKVDISAIPAGKSRVRTQLMNRVFGKGYWHEVQNGRYAHVYVPNALSKHDAFNMKLLSSYYINRSKGAMKSAQRLNLKG